MAFTYTPPPVQAHSHTTVAGDGGALDTEDTALDSTTIRTFVMLYG